VGGYSTLGVRDGASAAEVTAAYRQLIKLYHPDAVGGGKVERFHEIRRAYEQLRPLLRGDVSPLKIDVYA
jgi:DnaJ-class molecular chaperone